MADELIIRQIIQQMASAVERASCLVKANGSWQQNRYNTA